MQYVDWRLTELMDNVLAIGVIVGIGNAVKGQFPKVTGIIGIAISVVLGIVFGYAGLFGVSGLEQGILVGLAASGIYTLSKRIGGK